MVIMVFYLTWALYAFVLSGYFMDVCLVVSNSLVLKLCYGFFSFFFVLYVEYLPINKKDIW